MGSNGNSSSMVILLLVGGVCCCCIMSSAGLGAAYYFNDTVREFIDGLIGTSDKERAQMFKDKGCKFEHRREHPPRSGKWGCHFPKFSFATTANNQLKNKRDYVIQEYSGVKKYLYDAECVSSQDCADLINDAKTI